MKDYELTLKVRNAPFLNAMRERGYNTAAELSRATGVRQTVIGEYLNLKLTPFTLKGEYRPSIVQICEFLHVELPALFPPQHLDAPLEQNTFVAQVSAADMGVLGCDRETDPAALLERDEEDQVDLMQKIFDSGELTDRQRAIMSALYSEDKTVNEVGKELGISGCRVQQIHMTLLRKLRHPSRYLEYAEHLPEGTR